MRVVAPHLLHQRVAAEDNAAIGGEQVQQIEFVRRQFDLTILQAGVSSRRIDGQPAGDDGGSMSRGTRRPSSQQRTHARNELANAERLGQIVVGAALETENLVGFLATRRQHQNRHVPVHRLAADRTAHGHPIELRQHDVEDQ